MIEKRTIIEKREVAQDGTVGVRFRKEIVEDGKVIAFEYHRTTLPPGFSLDAQMGLVNAHFVVMGYPSLKDYESVRRIVDVEHTPEVIAAWKVAQAAREKDE